MIIFKLSHFPFMCMNGYGQAWETLMMSKMKSANDMCAVSGSQFYNCFFLCVKTQEEGEKQEWFPSDHIY